MVVGLLTDVEGVPISVEVFDGNTQDPKTVWSQIRKMADRFGVEAVTLVGDRGMVKSAQIQMLNEASFYYLTAITKPQIHTLLRQGVLQLTLFDEAVCEVSVEGVRYIVRRNPDRAEEIARMREDKLRSVCQRVEKENMYLREHPRARVEVAVRRVRAYAEQLRIADWVEVSVEGRRIGIEEDPGTLERVSCLDGCYVLKSDVPKEAASAEQLHARYKDLGRVEEAFRTMKTSHLEIRPVYVRTAAHTRAHVFIVMLAYRLRRELEVTWGSLDLTVAEGLSLLSSLCAQEIMTGNGGGYLSVPEPRASVAEVLAACGVRAPSALPRRKGKVATKRKLPSRRKRH
jgi:transposase